MMKEGAYAGAESSEGIERRGELSEQSIRDFIETRHEISNSGHNGIILKFLENELPADIRKAISFDEEENPEGSLSVKALKIYNSSDANKEFASLQKARRIVAKNNDAPTPLARVPKAHASYDLEISDAFQKFLNENGASLVDKKVGVVVMDYIEGVDLATLLYREALKRTHQDNDPYMPDDLEHMPFNELHRTLASKLHFATPGGKSRDENARAFEEEKVKNENAEKLFNTLEEKGFVLPQAVLDQVKGTIEAFHQNNFYHNDLHERQVILKDGDLKNPKTFIIDYGTASEGRPSAEPGRKVMNDEAIVRRLSRLTKTTDQREQEREETKAFEWNERLVMIAKQPRLEEQYKALDEAIKISDEKTLDNHLAYSSSTEVDLKNFLAMLIKISRENPDQHARVIDFLSAHEHDKKKRPFFVSQLKQAREVISGE